MKTEKFPSPFGVYGFSIGGQPSLKGTVILCFRPLSGFMVSQCVENVTFGLDSFVSVPFRGLWFLNKRLGLNIFNPASFRPLSGFMVSQCSAKPA